MKAQSVGNLISNGVLQQHDPLDAQTRVPEIWKCRLVRHFLLNFRWKLNLCKMEEMAASCIPTYRKINNLAGSNGSYFICPTWDTRKNFHYAVIFFHSTQEKLPPRKGWKINSLISMTCDGPQKPTFPALLSVGLRPARLDGIRLPRHASPQDPGPFHSTLPPQ